MVRIEVQQGDMIEYESNGVRVIIYARDISNPNYIRDGNIICSRDQVTRIVHTAEEVRKLLRPTGEELRRIAQD